MVSPGEYCSPSTIVWYLRKSEDLALCYDVVQRQGGHILKVQSYCYTAVHLQHGGAEAIRAECRQGNLDPVGELIQGANLELLTPAHRNVANALLQWLHKAQMHGLDRQGGKLHEMDRASQAFWRHLQASSREEAAQSTAWLEPLREVRRLNSVGDSHSRSGHASGQVVM